jgi:hypothetical protein
MTGKRRLYEQFQDREHLSLNPLSEDKSMRTGKSTDMIHDPEQKIVSLHNCRGQASPISIRRRRSHSILLVYSYYGYKRASKGGGRAGKARPPSKNENR